MESRTEPVTQWPDRLMVFTFLAFLGLILGIAVPLIGGLGAILLSAGVLLWFAALVGRKDWKWSSEVNFYGEALVVFGAMAAIGGGVAMWLEIVQHL